MSVAMGGVVGIMGASTVMRVGGGIGNMTIGISIGGRLVMARVVSCEGWDPWSLGGHGLGGGGRSGRCTAEDGNGGLGGVCGLYVCLHGHVDGWI